MSIEVAGNFVLMVEWNEVVVCLVHPAKKSKLIHDGTKFSVSIFISPLWAKILYSKKIGLEVR